MCMYAYTYVYVCVHVCMFCKFCSLQRILLQRLIQENANLIIRDAWVIIKWVLNVAKGMWRRLVREVLRWRAIWSRKAAWWKSQPNRKIQLLLSRKQVCRGHDDLDRVQIVSQLCLAHEQLTSQTRLCTGALHAIPSSAGVNAGSEQHRQEAEGSCSTLLFRSTTDPRSDYSQRLLGDLCA